MSEEKKTTERAKASRSNLADENYDLGRDIGQKVLWAVMMLVAFIVPASMVAFWLLGASIIGYLIVHWFVAPSLRKKSEELLMQENPKRFLGMSPRIWNGIVAISLAAFLIFALIKDFEVMNIIIYLIGWVISYGVLTKNATVVSTETEETRKWKEENGVERVYGITHATKSVWRDKNGNYYALMSSNHYIAIPTPVEIINKNKK